MSRNDSVAARMLRLGGWIALGLWWAALLALGGCWFAGMWFS